MLDRFRPCPGAVVAHYRLCYKNTDECARVNTAEELQTSWEELERVTMLLPRRRQRG